MTLQVGDKVRFRHAHTRSFVGETGTVVAAEPQYDNYEVLPDNGRRLGAGCAKHKGAGSWNRSALEKIEEEQPRPLGLRPGDKVVNLKTGREGLVLKGPVSGELKVYDQKPPIRDAVPAAALEEYEFHYPGTYDVWRRVTREALVRKVGTPW